MILSSAASGSPFSRFIEHFKCYSYNKLTQTLRSSPAELNYQGKIILPPSALAKLSALHIAYPMLFEITNPSNASCSNAGVLEFVAEEGRCYLPLWMMKCLKCNDGDIIRISSATLPQGQFLKIQPQSVDFLDISDPKAVLENALRQYSALRQGNIISIKYNNKIYDLLCMEVKPGGEGISILETDLSVDFAPPVGYVEPNYQAKNRHVSSSSMVI